MQPVLDILKLGEHSYTYTVHATRPTGAPVPEACYVDRGLPSFVECLRDAAEALTYFPRVHVRFQGRCVGEQLVSPTWVGDLRVSPPFDEWVFRLAARLADR